MAINLQELNIKIFVFGTLLKGRRLDFYMDGGKYKGKYYSEGQLMKAENGSVYIDFDYKNIATLGELHYVNFHCLQRINHLEAVSGEFPKGYDLALLPIWKLEEEGKYTYNSKNKSYAFFYRRRNRPLKIKDGDYKSDFKPIEEIKKFLTQDNIEKNPEKVIDFYKSKLNNIEF